MFIIVIVITLIEDTKWAIEDALEKKHINKDAKLERAYSVECVNYWKNSYYYYIIKNKLMNTGISIYNLVELNVNSCNVSVVYRNYHIPMHNGKIVNQSLDISIYELGNNIRPLPAEHIKQLCWTIISDYFGLDYTVCQNLHYNSTEINIGYRIPIEELNNREFIYYINVY